MAESGEDKSGGRGIPEGLKEAIEGAFAATGGARAQAQDLTEKTRSRAQGLVDEFTKRGSEARGTLDGLRLVSRDELRQLEDKIERLSSRVAELERKSKSEPEG
jgi:polyhydroxyalkanoate synthesis regulator phasin